jgi:SAM-dependent methyltransferase
MSEYSSAYYEAQGEGSLSSARAILPPLLQAVPVRSVLDVGCGSGTWLKVCKELGATEVLGVDGSVIAGNELKIEAGEFRRQELNEPFDLGRRFDLVISVEVAEHLLPSVSAQFVRSLAAHGDLILFSAAIPFQGGVHHTNERWQSYWAGLFRDIGFEPVDCVRSRVWADEKVEMFYAQNTLLYVRSASAANYPRLPRGESGTGRAPLDIVHPKLFVSAATNPARLGVRHVLRELPRLLARRMRAQSPANPRPPP